MRVVGFQFQRLFNPPAVSSSQRLIARAVAATAAIYLSASGVYHGIDLVKGAGVESQDAQILTIALWIVFVLLLVLPCFLMIALLVLPGVVRSSVLQHIGFFASISSIVGLFLTATQVYSMRDYTFPALQRLFVQVDGTRLSVKVSRNYVWGSVHKSVSVQRREAGWQNQVNGWNSNYHGTLAHGVVLQHFSSPSPKITCVRSEVRHRMQLAGQRRSH